MGFLLIDLVRIAFGSVRVVVVGVGASLSGVVAPLVLRMVRFVTGAFLERKFIDLIGIAFGTAVVVVPLALLVVRELRIGFLERHFVMVVVVVGPTWLMVVVVATLLVLRAFLVVVALGV